MSKVTNPTTEYSISCGFFNSDPVAKDRKYYASDFNKMLDGVITNGVFQNIGECLIPTAAGGYIVSIGSGKAWFNQRWIENDSTLLVDCGVPEAVLDRIDAIVIEVNSNDDVRDCFIKHVKGAYNSQGDPERPIMINEGNIHQHPLCYIYRPANSTEISNTDITVTVGLDEETPFVTSILETGTIEGYFASWEEQFVNWFEKLQADLSGDVAANIQNQIYNLDNRMDVLPNEFKLVKAAEFTTPGTHSWTPNESQRQAVFVIVGAGGGGAGAYAEYPSTSSASATSGDYIYTIRCGRGGDGGSGIVTSVITLNPGEPISIVIGEGGNGGIPAVYDVDIYDLNDVKYTNSRDNKVVTGENGGSTTCKLPNGVVLTALGGYAGCNYINNAGANSSNVDQSRSPEIYQNSMTPTPFGGRGGYGNIFYDKSNSWDITPDQGIDAEIGSVAHNSKGSSILSPVSPLVYITSGGSGGTVGYYINDTKYKELTPSITQPTIIGEATGVGGHIGSADGGQGAPGCGGGGGGGITHTVKKSNQYQINELYASLGNGGKGGDGYVLIYTIGGEA